MADLGALQRLRGQLRKDGDSRGVGILEMTAQGAAWPPARKAAAGQPIDPQCQFCKQALGTFKHQAWQCPVILAGIGAAREDTKDIEGHVMKEDFQGEAEQRASWGRGLPPPQCDALWCRGIMPMPGTGPLELLLQVARSGQTSACTSRWATASA